MRNGMVSWGGVSPFDETAAHGDGRDGNVIGRAVLDEDLRHGNGRNRGPA